jgi:hypothetical protein
MKRNYIGLALGALITVGAVLSLPSCGHDRKLVSIEVLPSSFTFGTPAPGATGQFRAIGTFIHPPVTRDITDQATWTVDDNVVTVNQGLVTTTGGCGSTNVTATMPEGTGGSSNIIFGAGFVVVHDTTDPNCP